MHLFTIETTLRTASIGGKPDRKPYHRSGFRNQYKTINHERILKFVQEKHFVQAKTKVCEISRLYPETSTKLYFHEFHLGFHRNISCKLSDLALLWSKY